MYNNDVELLFVGGVFPKELEEEIMRKSSHYLQSAANNCQWRFINGFDYNNTKPVTILNQIFVGSYPKNYKDPIVHSSKFSHIDGANDINLGFINVKYIKEVIPPFHEKKQISDWIEANDKRKIIFIYSLSNKTIRITKYIKKHWKNCIVVTYVGDLPQNFMRGRQNNILVKHWVNLQARHVRNNIHLIDFFVFVAEQQAKVLGVDSEKYIVIEGIANSLGREYSPISDEENKRIVYAGGLLPQYNIKGLLEAFSEIKNSNISLVFMGDGPEKDIILESKLKDNRIKYLGVLSQEDAMAEMKKAWVLVNPTLSKEDFTKLSFPIKLIDYLFAGRPVISQKLGSIPKEYDEHLIYFDETHTLKERILEVLSYDIQDVEQIGLSNYDFIINEKAEIAQTKKLLKRIEDIK